MGRGISMATRKELIQALGGRYCQGTRSEKARILDEFVAVTGYHRKHAIRALRTWQRDEGGTRPPRKRIYDEAVREALIVMWEAADRICGKRLKAVLPELLAAMERHGHVRLDSAVRTKLLAMSAASIDRVLAPIREKAKGRRKRRRVMNSAVKRQVPIRTFADWGNPVPGFFESDFVVHCGGVSAGSCVHTLVVTDIASGWTECLPLVVREQSMVVQALEILRTRLPVDILGLDFDNDGAFMNQTVLDYCRSRRIELTRSRAYKKNDQAWIEQKNGSVVRRLVGYERYVGFEDSRTLARLFEVARLYVNFFQPSFKLRSKHREGAKVKKQYDAPTTPCERLLRDPRVGDAVKQALRDQRDRIDPVLLLRDLRHAQAELAAAVKNRGENNANTSVGEFEQFLAQLPGLWREGEVRPTHRKPPPAARTWRTRVDPFESVWPEVISWLQTEPDATAKVLFQRLMRRYPDEFAPGQLRTLQRRVRDWRREMARQLVYANLSATTPEHLATSMVE